MRILITGKRNLINAVAPDGGSATFSCVRPHTIDGLSSNGRISCKTKLPRRCPASHARRGLKKKKVGERRSTIFRGYSRVLCNRRPMHLAGQRALWPKLTRAKMFVLTLVPAYPSPPACIPSLLAPIQPPDAALNYSECEKIRKIRPSCSSVHLCPSPAPFILLTILSRWKSWPNDASGLF